jgi:3-oxoacyl-[acyl-carrier-protein] synthase II
VSRRDDDAVVVTGMGLVTPAGVGPQENWARICAGTSTAARDERFAGAPYDFTCRLDTFDAAERLGRAKAWKLDRFAQFAVVATRDAVADAGLDPATWDDARVGVVIGNSLGGSETWERQHRTLLDAGADDVSPLTIPMTMVNMVAGVVAMDCGARGPSLVTATACASGTTAIATGLDMLRSGRCDVVLAGGTEAALTPGVLNALHRMGALSARRDDPASASRPFDADRDGFVAAEAAGILVLERRADARARSATPYVTVAGSGGSSDAHHLTAPDPQGLGMELALTAALEDAGVAPSDVDHVNAHGTSTPLNDRTESSVLKRVLGNRATVTSTKGVTGHPLAAAGAIEAAYAALTVRHQCAPPTANLETLDRDVDLDIVSGAPRAQRIDVAVSTSLGFGGHNAALVLTAA